MTRLPPGPRKPRVHTRVTRQGIELRVDGTLASLIRPGHHGTGPVWDALAAPLLGLAPGRLRRLLVLGFGGGSVARLARAIAPGVQIVGVELDAGVIREARRHFGLNELGAEIVVDDAVRYLERERRSFDAIVDDVYEGRTQHLRKPRTLVERYDLVTRRLAPGGVLVVNTLDETAEMARLVRPAGRSLLCLSLAEYENRILAAGPSSLTGDTLRAALRAQPMFAASLPQMSVRRWRGPAAH